MRRGIEEQNRGLLERLHRVTSGPFGAREAAAALSISVERGRRLLSYLAGRGWLSRVRHGLYTTVPLGASEPGAWREDPWVVASRVFAPCYIGGWSACEHWALTEQVFRDVVVVTGRAVRSRQAELQGTLFLLKRLAEGKHFGTRVVWKGQVKTRVSDPTRTVVDLLDDPSLGGGIRHIASVVRAYLDSEHRNEKRLLDYTAQLGNRTVYKRLGFILDTLGLEAPTLVMACQERMSSGLSPLDPTVHGKARVLKRWNLRVNVRLEGSGSAS